MLNLHGPGGCLSQFDSKEAPFVPGTEVAPDVLQVEEGDVAPWHARVWIAETRMQVEDLPGGALANGRPIEERGRVKDGSCVTRWPLRTFFGIRQTHLTFKVLERMLPVIRNGKHFHGVPRGVLDCRWTRVPLGFPPDTRRGGFARRAIPPF